jgi:hypothetical protein
MIRTEGEMRALSPTEPKADKVDFDVWHASKKIGTAHRTADGYIVVKLDADVRVISRFILYPV